MSQQIIELIEYTPKFLKRNELSQELGEKILNISEYVEIEFPTPKTQGRWRLISNGWAGALKVDHDITIFLQPKINISNILAMWEYAYRLTNFQLFKGVVGCVSISGFYNKIALMLSNLIIERCKKGLYKCYIDITDRTPYITGKIDFKDTLYHAGSPYLKCSYQENTVNNKYNQILLWTLEIIRRTNELKESRNVVVQAIRMLMGTIDLVPITCIDCVHQDYNTLNADYKIMHSICRFILEFSAPQMNHGSNPMLPYVINMSRLYELFVTEWLKIHAPSNIGIKEQEYVSYGSEEKLNFKIDLVLYDKSTGAATCVIDTKYKLSDKMAKPDVHQIISYMEAKKCSVGVLLYPSNQNIIKRYPINSKTVYQVRIDLCGDIENGGQFLLDFLADIFKQDKYSN